MLSASTGLLQVVELLFLMGVALLAALSALYLSGSVLFFRVLERPVGLLVAELERWRDVRRAVFEVGLEEGHLLRFGDGVPGYVRRRMEISLILLFLGYAVAPTVLAVALAPRLVG